MTLEPLADDIVEVCRKASVEILNVYNDEAAFEVDIKSDNSPVTKADIAANAVIVRELEALTPDIPVLTEESSMVPYSERQHWDRYWIVDPLDGTKEFIRRNDQFTVNIALVEGNRATLGVVYVPVTDIAYVGLPGISAYKQIGSDKTDILCRKMRSQGDFMEVVASANHSNPPTEAFVSALQNICDDVRTKSIGSSLKFCLVAEGLADVYPRFAPTSEWDTAAAQAVLEAAGGAVFRKDLHELAYNTKENILNPDFFAVADVDFDWRSVVQHAIAELD